jgi:hypothetical protein
MDQDKKNEVSGSTCKLPSQSERCVTHQNSEHSIICADVGVV